jgi:hypothetical protein
MNEQQACSWLSEPRYGRFRVACGGKHESAVDLYEWHAVLSMACFGLIHHFEVLLRNAIDIRLGDSQPQQPIKDTWLVDFDVLRPSGVKQVMIAIERLEHGDVVTRGRVVARLSFSFWTDLFGNRYEELWRQVLRAVFPQGAVTRRDVGTRLRRVQRFRNRIAHHDSLLGQDVPGLLDDMLEVAGWIDRDARSWLEAQTGAVQLAHELDRLKPFAASRT